MRFARERVGLAAVATAALLLLASGVPARAAGGRPADRPREEDGAEASDPIHLGLRLGIFAPFIAHLDGRATMAGAGGRVDLRDLGDLGDIEYSPSLGAWIDFGRWVSIDLDYVALWLEGEGNAPGDAPIVFDGVSFSPGESVDTRVVLHMADIALRINAVHLDRFQLGLRLGARYVNAGTRLHTLDRTARADLDGVVPFIGAVVSISPARGVGFYGSVKAGLLDYDSRGSWWFGSSGSDASREHRLLDAEVGLSLAPHERVGVFIAYRWVDVSLEREEDLGDREDFEAVLHGPHCGLFFSF